MTRILLVAGTRPEAIKLAPLYLELRRSTVVDVALCVTGQHREMLAPALDFFDIEPEYALDVMTPDQGLPQLTSRLLPGLDEIYAHARPDLVVVQGDTTTTMAASLVACYRRLAVAHVEAGLRSFDSHAPHPEEINRTITTRCAHYHFAPTNHARRNLAREGIPACRTWVVGNTVIDALLLAQGRVRGREPTEIHPPFADIDFSKPLLLVTAHRRESFGAPLRCVCTALARIADEHDVEIIYPVHLNPRVREAVCGALGPRPNIHLLPPLPYPVMVWLMDRARLILTDSGGIQEEAPALRKPVLVLRDVTERPEGIACGVARLVGTSETRIVAEVARLLRNPGAYARMASGRNPYGDGRASGRIRCVLEAATGARRLRSTPQPPGLRHATNQRLKGWPKQKGRAT